MSRKAEIIDRFTAKGGLKDWTQRVTGFFIPAQYKDGKKLSAKVSLLLENLDETGAIREKQSFRMERVHEATRLMKLVVRMVIRFARENGATDENIIDALKFNINDAIMEEMGKPKLQQKLPIKEVWR